MPSHDTIRKGLTTSKRLISRLVLRHGYPASAKADLREAFNAILDALAVMDGDDFVLTLQWTCQSCGWATVVDAPGFAGDGRFHYINGETPCGPLYAQKS